MRVFQFGFDGDPANTHLPHNYIPNTVAYTGTHDNNTLLGFVWESSDSTRRDLLDYCGFTDTRSANGVVFLAVVNRLGTLPDSEMAEVRLFDALPDNLTYPNVSPRLYREAAKRLPQGSPP
jgi:4-alpha-glucanotransferase